MYTRYQQGVGPILVLRPICSFSLSGTLLSASLFVSTCCSLLLCCCFCICVSSSSPSSSATISNFFLVLCLFRFSLTTPPHKTSSSGFGRLLRPARVEGGVSFSTSMSEPGYDADVGGEGCEGVVEPGGDDIGDEEPGVPSPSEATK